MSSKPTTDLSQEQINILEENFRKLCKHPEGVTLTLISAETGLTEEETLAWFKWRNSQWRKAEGLPAKEGSVLD
ncbi:homeodomain-only protein [Pholidichthys leucotaenia]